MITQTIILALAFGLLALSRRASGAAIGVLVASMLIWPEFLRIPLGLFEASVPRLVALMLVARAIVQGSHRNVSGCNVDRIVLAIWAWTVLASIFAGSPFSHVSQMIGRGFDTVLMYFVIRFYITSAENLKELARWLILVAVVMGVLGVIETTTTRSPYSGMDAFRAWSWISKEDQFRSGFLRAKGSTSIHIYFGMAMMLVTGMLLSINKGLLQQRFGSWGILLGFLGALSSMSSGPWLACAIMLTFGLYQYRPDLIRPSLVLILLMSIFMEILSNRHFYNLIDYLALDPHTAWYRTRLMEVAATHVSEFWIVGVGAQWPHHWGAILDGRDHIDVVNNFLIVALYGGLPAMVLFLASHAFAISRVTALWRSRKGGDLRRVAFSLAVVLVALDLSSLSVGLFGPPLLLSNMLLGLIVAVTGMQCAPEQILTPQSFPRNLSPQVRQDRT